jgi:hypothetical protein
VASEEFPGGSSGPAGAGGADRLTVRDGLRLIEVLFDRFDDIVAKSNDATILSEAQHEAALCGRWLALVGEAQREDIAE